MSLENKPHYDSEKEAIHLILTGIRDEIYSTVDACKIAQEMWESIERLKQEQSDWVTDTDEEIDEQELEARYSYMVKIQEVPTADSGTDSKPLEQVQYDAGYNVFANEIQHSEQSESIRNTCIVETYDSNVIPDSANIKTLGESNSIPDGSLVVLQTKQTKFEKYKACNDRTVDYDKLEHLKYIESLEKEIDERESDKVEFSNMYDMILQECVSNEIMCTYLLSLSDLDALAELQCLYLHKVKECDSLEQKLSKKTESVSKEVHTELLQRFAKVEKHSISLEIALQKYLKAQLQDKNIAISELKKLIEKGKGKYMETKFDKPSVVRQPNAQRIPKPSILGVNHKTNVSRPQHMNNQLKDKVVPNNSHVKLKKTQVEEHPRTSSISNKLKSVTACNDSLNSRTSKVNVVCATCKKCLVDSDHFACVTKMLNDVNARTKKPNVVPISTRKPKSHTKNLL
nr:hypothetical protein [Tanacetum cinerariifolium]